MEFTMVSKVTYKMADDFKLRGMLHFQEAVKNGDIEVEVHDMEMYVDGVDVAEGVDKSEIVQAFMDAVTEEEA